MVSLQMTKRKKRVIHSNGRKKLNLDKVGETSETQQESSQNDKDLTNIPPPFKGSSDDFIKKADVSLILKVLSISFVALGVISSVIWYSAKLSSDVDRLKTDVIEVKKNTEEISKETRKHEKNISNISIILNSLTKNKK